MAEPKLLEGVLGNTLVPHQPLVIVTYSPCFPALGLGLFAQLLSRSARSGQKNVLVTALRPPSSFLPSSPDSSVNIDLTSSVAGYGDSPSLSYIESRIIAALPQSGPGSSLFIDALDILAEDYSQPSIIRLFRTLLKTIKDKKPPSRLILLLPAHSPLLPTLLPPTISPTLTLLIPHPPALLTHLSTSYLTDIDASPKFWGLLETAQSRRLAEDLAFRGVAGLEIGSTSAANGNGSATDMGVQGEEGYIVQVLVRKAQGGIKGISRSLEAVLPAKAPASISLSQTSSLPGQARGEWSVHPISALIPIRPIIAQPQSQQTQHQGQGLGSSDTNVKAKPTTHAELDLPFNLNLTDAQRRARMGVPLPYAHEGEGAGVELEFEDEDEEDEEI